MVLKLFKFIIGILLIPPCIAITQTLWILILSIHPDTQYLVPPPALALLSGLLLWLALFFVAPRPVRSYILAHELTHALWGMLMGAEIFSIKVSDNQGYVELSKNNFVITLAPYFFPLYTVLIIAAYYVTGIFFDVERFNIFWLVAIGFTWGFHLTFTIAALMQHQTDIQQHGRIFSYSVIYLLNILGICFWVIMVSPATLETMVSNIHDKTISISEKSFDLAKQQIEILKKHIPTKTNR